MLNKEINIPSFKLWKLIVFGLLITLGVINLLQWNSAAELRIKNKELDKSIEIKDKVIDSVLKVNLVIDKELVKQSNLIKDYNNKVNYYKNQSYKYKQDYEKSINDYNALNREQRFQSVRQLINE